MHTTWSEESTSHLSRVTYLGIDELGIIHLVHNIMHIMPIVYQSEPPWYGQGHFYSRTGDLNIRGHGRALLFQVLGHSQPVSGRVSGIYTQVYI